MPLLPNVNLESLVAGQFATEFEGYQQPPVSPDENEISSGEENIPDDTPLHRFAGPETFIAEPIVVPEVIASKGISGMSLFHPSPMSLTGHRGETERAWFRDELSLGLENPRTVESGSAWRPTPDETILHRMHGKIDVVKIEKNASGVEMLYFVTPNDVRFGELLKPDEIAPLDPSSIQYQRVAAARRELFIGLPQIIGVAFSNYLALLVRRPVPSAVLQVVQWDGCAQGSAAGMCSIKPQVDYNRHFVLDKTPSGSSMIGNSPNWHSVKFHRGLKEDIRDANADILSLWERTGIDPIAMGIQCVNGDPESLAFMLTCLAKFFWAKPRFRQEFVIAPEAFEVLGTGLNSLSRVIGASLHVPVRLWAAGDYDRDHTQYLALRDGDPAARSFFADRMVAMILQDAQLREAAVLVPVPGRENHGRPVDALAREIAQKLSEQGHSVQIVENAWRPRSKKRKESESGMPLREKIKQAMHAYHLKSTKEILSLVEGKVIILVDDNITTGATAGACALELVGHGATKVLRLVATRTDRYREYDVNPMITYEQLLSQDSQIAESLPNIPETSPIQEQLESASSEAVAESSSESSRALNWGGRVLNFILDRDFQGNVSHMAEIYKLSESELRKRLSEEPSLPSNADEHPQAAEWADAVMKGRERWSSLDGVKGRQKKLKEALQAAGYDWQEVLRTVAALDPEKAGPKEKFLLHRLFNGIKKGGAGFKRP